MYEPSKVEQYLKPGEMGKLLSQADRLVYGYINGTVKRHRLSKMATVLACYRLVALGLIEEKPSRRRTQGRSDLIS